MDANKREMLFKNAFEHSSATKQWKFASISFKLGADIPEKYLKAKLNTANPTAPISNVYNVVESVDVLVYLFICFILVKSKNIP